MGLSFVGCHCVCFGGGPAAEKPHTPTLRPLAYFCGTAGAIYRAIRRITQDSARPSGTFGAVGCFVARTRMDRGHLWGDQWHLGKKTGQYDERDVADDVGRFEGNRRGK